jgi:hypothetical protein
MTAWRGKRTIAAVVALSVAALVPACGGARNSLGTNASTCYRAVPAARKAIGKGQLVGVRRIHTSELQRRLPNDTKLAAVQAKQLCVFAFHGTYQPGDVPLATPQRAGTYAVVAVTIINPTAVTASVLDHLPTRFGHLH